MMSMHIQLASDLHLDRLAGRFPGETLIRPAAAADVLVLAGDIACGVDGVRLFADWPVPVLYVPGNHEFFDADWQRTRDALRRAAEGSAVRVLDEDECVFGGVRFLGCTLWTDYLLDPARSQASQMADAGRFMRDHAVIHVGDELFSPQHALADHARSRDWLQRRLQQSFDGPTVVVTHHGPSERSVHPRFAGHPANPAYVSRLDAMASRADAWLHGHVHDSFDYVVQGERGRGCRVVANPRGYARRREQARSAAELDFENPHFAAQCLLRIGESAA